MWKTVLRRFLLMIPQLILLSIIAFAFAKLMPGDPFTGQVDPNIDPEAIERLRIQYGYYDPIHIQYFRWIGNILHGDFGQSVFFKQPVSTIIMQRLNNTIWLSLLTMVITYVIALPLGMIAGRYQNSIADKMINVYNFLTFSTPVFIFAILLLWLFGFSLGWFPTRGSIASGVTGLEAIFSRLQHMILPALTLAILSTTSTIQYLRTGVIDAKAQDYVRTARAKGVPEKVVYNRHIFRNSILPIAAFLGYELTGLVTGSVFVENIFTYPGIGQLFITSLSGRDYSVILALLLMFGFGTLLGTLLSDIIMSIVDPRIRVK
ncbi:oligopeptide ABC transporter permease [Streptococcus acidominimus]|uniref:ABC transporter permease n=1 Tax=Streptococcus acidominimus TaxID=1326 RepID=A0A1Q8EBH1_STRAI|nr:oligopeptide ABC transporter permease [Streptococcus acidominimus]MBF0849016.1 ABC transporter permease [Streptococcus danieliae]MBF0819447.1 ABC transporter permease [Streptococcus acidominimus]MBF0838156.1 ABC transporter permease [Streptococcus acidominimus]OLF49138.1 peptide ABC transporter permease [Streptococcus acidominimus]TFU29886.1 ABC transporter permease [Streptococcus acidominimus]